MSEAPRIPTIFFAIPARKSIKLRPSRPAEDRARRERDTAYTQMLDIGVDEDERGGHGGLIFLIILLLIIAALVVGYFIFNIDYFSYISKIIEHFKK